MFCVDEAVGRLANDCAIVARDHHDCVAMSGVVNPTHLLYVLSRRRQFVEELRKIVRFGHRKAHPKTA